MICPGSSTAGTARSSSSSSSSSSRRVTATAARPHTRPLSSSSPSKPRRRATNALPDDTNGDRQPLSVRAIGFRFGDDDDDDAEDAALNRRGGGDDDDRPSGPIARRASPSAGDDAAPVDDGRPLPPIVPRLTQSSNLRAQSLLVLSPVLRSGPVGEAFSNLLATATRYQAKNSEIAAAYSRLYSAMLATGSPSWPDYLVDQVLAGRDNPIARAAAQGQLDFGEAPALKALEADLDALQELAAPLRSVAAYVGDVAPTVPARWVAAAGADPSCRKAGGAAGAGAGGGGGATGGGASGGRNAAAPAIDVAARSRFVRPPPTEAEYGAWRAAVQGHGRWSKALPLLQAYWHLHGFGVTSRASALRWSAGGLEEVPGAAGGAAAAIAAAVASSAAAPAAAAAGKDGGGGAAAATGTTTSAFAAMDAVQLSSLALLREAVERNLARHAAGLPDAPARPLLLAGPPGSGKSSLLREAALRSAAVARGGLRVVDVGPAELPNLLEAARGCGRYPRVRFVLLADDVPLPLAGGASAAWASELLAALAAAGGGGGGGGESGSGSGGGGAGAAWWPSNVLLHVAASANSAVGWGDPLAQRCGGVLALPPAGEEGFLGAVRELLAAAAAAAAAGGAAAASPPSLDEAAAVAWAKGRGALSVRGAAAYARELVADAAFERAVKEGRAGF